MATNLSDYESLIYNYMLTRLREKYPSLSLGSNSLISDKLLNPFIDILKPFITKLHDIDNKQLLSNFDSISVDDYTNIGEQNYFVSRINGRKASGYVYIEFQNIPTGMNVTIPPGTTVGKSEEYQYMVNSNILVGYDDLPTYYDAMRLVYSIPVFVEASAVGSLYNAEVNEISMLFTTLQYSTGKVYNAVSITNGANRETNEDYYYRLKDFYLAKNIGSKSGFRQFVLDNFDLVEDLIVIGYKDPLMDRDIIDDGGVPRHIGGKVDIYVKGFDLGSYEDSFKLNTHIYFFKYPPVLEDSIVISNNTDSTKSVGFVFGYKNPAERGSVLEESYALIESGASPGDELKVEYRYVDSRGVEDNSIEYFYLNSSLARFTHAPFYNVTRVVNLSQLGKIDLNGDTLLEKDVIIPPSKYITSYSGNTGNIFESCTITLDPIPGNRDFLQLSGSPFPNYSLGVVSESSEITPGVDGVAEVFDLTITGGATSDGNITLTINGTPHNIGVTGGDTPGLIALTIRNFADDLEDYNAAVNGSIVTVTARNLRAETDAIFSGGTTGVTGTISITTQGITGSIQVDTVTVMNTASNSGTVQVYVSDGDISESVSIDLLADDYPNMIAAKIGTALLNNPAVFNNYAITSSLESSTLTFTRKKVGKVSFYFDIIDNETGDNLKVIYTCNDLIINIQKAFSDEDKRNVTADVLVKHANISYVYTGISIHPKLGYSIGTVEKTYISSLVASYVNTTNFISSLSADGIVSIIRNDTKISTFLDYIELPIIFYTLNVIEGNLRENTQEFNIYNSVVNFESTYYPMLQLCEVSVI